MLLAPDELQLLFKLHSELMFYVNHRLKVIRIGFSSPVEFAHLPPKLRVEVRDALTADLELIDSFVAENPAHFKEEELEIVRSWRHLVSGRFYVFRDLKKHTVFLSTTSPTIAYGVTALSQPFEELVGPDLPVMIETALLPFKNSIVYDGVVGKFGISFGPGIRRELNDAYGQAKERQGIVTSLPASDTPLPPKAPKSKPAPKLPSREDKEESLRTVIGLVDQFCKQHLNEEYAVMCCKMAEKLSRKRPSPLLRGSPNAWASGIVRAVGRVNFLDDKTQRPHMKFAEIDHHLGTSSSSGAAKLAEIRKMLKLHEFDVDWTLPSRLEDNPMVWMFQVNGFMIDIRHASRELQEAAFNQGLIPYIPADRLDED